MARFDTISLGYVSILPIDSPVIFTSTIHTDDLPADLTRVSDRNSVDAQISIHGWKMND